MSRLSVACMLIAVLLSPACEPGSDGGPTPSPTPPPTPTATPIPSQSSDCDPILELLPTDASVLNFDLWRPQAQGGTGEYRFQLLQNESGAIVNELTGTYLAGLVCDTTDIIELTD